MSARPDRKSPILTGNLAARSAFQRREYLKDVWRLDHQTDGGAEWDCPGNKVRSQRERLADSLCPNRCLRDCLYVEPLRRRMRVRFGGTWIADSEQVVLLFEPGRYPVAYFPETDISPHALERTDHTIQHPDLGLTSWYAVRAGEHIKPRGASQHTALPAHASVPIPKFACACDTL
jgi:uncharacterized protein (DUF427 family)